MDSVENVKQAVMVIPSALSNAVMDWPAAIGFAGMEYIGYYIQNAAIEVWPDLPGVAQSSNRMIRGLVASTVRGGLFLANINYFNAYQGSGGGSSGSWADMANVGSLAGSSFGNLFGVPVQRVQL